MVEHCLCFLCHSQGQVYSGVPFGTSCTLGQGHWESIYSETAPAQVKGHSLDSLMKISLASDFLPLEMDLLITTQGVSLFHYAGCGEIQRDFSLLCRLNFVAKST